MTSPENTKYYLLSKLSGREQEVFCCLHLDNKHRVICFEELFFGSISSASVYPREVVKRYTGIGEYLSGDAGNDTYQFALGDGNTTISNYDAGVGRNDVLKFMSGIAVSDVIAMRSSTSLLLTVQSSGEVITVQSFFSGSNYELNAVEFADDTVWDTATIKTLVQQGTTGDDKLYGYEGADTLDGLGDNDYLYGVMAMTL